MALAMSRVLAHPMFAMVLGLLFILLKNHFSTQFYDWYWGTSSDDGRRSCDGTEFVEVHVTVPSIPHVYEPLIDKLVASGLATCVQVCVY